MDVRQVVALVIAVLDPSGVPEAVVHTRSVADFVRLHATETDGPMRVLTPDAVRRGLRALVRSSAVEFDRGRAYREIRTTPRAQHDLLETIPPSRVASVIRTAADALMEIRPSVQSPEEQWWSWRANARCLAARRPGVLWQPAGHDVLFALGASLAHENATDAGLYWHRLRSDATEFLPSGHPQRAAVSATRPRARPSLPGQARPDPDL
jgi:hypothetical protein